MNSTVVFRAARGLQRAGLRVLRFNFRGVGRSQGKHDGHGGESDDLGAALDWLEEREPDAQLWAAGFSFGARTVVARAVTDQRIARVVLIALPVAAFDCSAIKSLARPGLILMASNDEYGTRAELARQFPGLDPALVVEEIAGTGHFFEGVTAELQRRVQVDAERALKGGT